MKYRVPIENSCLKSVFSKRHIWIIVFFIFYKKQLNKDFIPCLTVGNCYSVGSGSLSICALNLTVKP